MAGEDQITGSAIKLSIGGGLRFDKDIPKNVAAGWTIAPSLGIVARDVDRLGLAIKNMKVPLEKSIKEVMIPSIRRNFDVGGRPPWEPLADYTVQVRGNTGPILQATGALKRGVTQLSIWDIGNSSATVKSLPQYIWYGAIHQEGLGSFGKHIRAAKKLLGGKASGKSVLKKAFELLGKVPPERQKKMSIPQRQFLMFQEDDMDDIQQVFAEWLEDEAKKVGRFTGRSVRTVWGGPSF